MGALIQAGQTPAATSAAGGLNQYYGYADAVQTTVTAASLANLSSVYTIPAGEAYAGAAYCLRCGGLGTWGSSAQNLGLAAVLDGTTIHTTVQVASAVFNTSVSFLWSAQIDLVCADGISQWFGSLKAWGQQNTGAVNIGTVASNAFVLTDSNSSAATAAVSSAVTVALQAKWASTTGSPTLTTYWTKFCKDA
jgi:hypothetical protein